MEKLKAKEMLLDYEIQIGQFNQWYVKQCALIIINRLWVTCLLDDETLYKFITHEYFAF